MFDQTDLNLRYRAHDDRIARVTASDAYTPEQAPRVRPRVITAALLLRLSGWLAPEVARQAAHRDAATA